MEAGPLRGAQLMQGRIIFLLEEPSMKILIEGLLPRLLPGMQVGEHFLCIKHEGKSDLDASIPRKLQAWRNPGDRFVILRDNDGANCTALKARFSKMCVENGRPDTLIRFVCQELESWYIGDLQALAEAFEEGRLNSSSLRKRFVDPDSWHKPSAELSRIMPSFQKGAAARAMAQTLDGARNRSTSFQFFVSGIRKLAAEMDY